jgi:hypothetical protein
MKEWPPRSNKGIWPKKRRGNDKGLSGGARHLPPEARSRRRDAGSGQAAIRVVATDHAHPRLADLSSLNPIRWRSSHRPRTEAKSRRRMSQVERGIDKQRPVTEARIMHDGENLCGDCSEKPAIHVANRCSDELHRKSAQRHSRHDRRYTASVRPAICPTQETHSRFCRRQPNVRCRASAASGGGAQARGLSAACQCDAGPPRRGPHPACDVRNGDGARFGDRLRL